MRIRQKITLWIAGTALVAAVSFSLFVFRETISEPYQFIDSELQRMASLLIEQGRANPADATSWRLDAAQLPYSPDQYWIMVHDGQGRVLYRSAITRYTDIPSGRGRDAYNVERIIPRKRLPLGQDERDGVMFRVREFRGQVAGRTVTVRIAKPVEEMEENLLDLLWDVLVGLSSCTLLIVLASYWLAGRILSPLVTINRLAQEISERSLDQRIPLGKNRDEIHALAVSLNRMFDRLQYSFKRQKEFIGNASHELKSPITLLRLNVEEVLLHRQLEPQLRQDLERQLTTLGRMSRLITGLLDLSRLEQQESIDHREVDLAELAGQVLAEYEEMLAARHIRLANELRPGELLVRGDQDKLLRLLINLVDNAIRYNLAEAGRIRLWGERRGDTCSLTVANSGTAIPAAEIERLFDQFYRLEKSRSPLHGGSGLGLTIAKKIVELHGGRIRITSDPGGWIEVMVHLPAGSG